MVSYLPVPSTASISFHPVKIFSNKRKDCSPLTEPEAVRFPVGDIPYAFQLNHVLSMFVEVKVQQVIVSPKFFTDQKFSTMFDKLYPHFILSLQTVTCCVRSFALFSLPNYILCG